MKTTKSGILLLLILLCANQLLAQDYGNFNKRPVAIGLVPPINTNGKNAGNCVNQFSLNLISGYSGALNGVEIGGFSNTERDFVHGAQFAGFANYVTGDLVGFQFAGFGNFNKGASTGFQFGGALNINHDEANGVLAAGFANIVKGKSTALQFAGFLNSCEDVNGSQIAGFTNIAKGDGKVSQIAGFLNTVHGEVKGLQIAGFTNISKGNLDGAQIAGFLNVSQQVDGLQLGFLNVADTIKSGIPIGFLSIVKKGFREFEFSVSEGLNAQAAFKIGVDKFYNIFAIGSQFIGDDFSWAIGYGLGTHLYKTERSKIQLELMSYHINEGEDWTSTYNDLQQIKLTFTKRVNEHFSIFAGPTANLMISNNKDNGLAFESNFAPYELYDHIGDHTTLKAWIGLTAGIRIN